MSDSETKSNELPSQHDTSHGQVMDHVYDGIREYDNPMPRWWVWIFWGSFWFSLAYLFHYWAGNGQSVAETYAAENAAVSEQKAKEAMSQELSEESLEKLLADAGSVEKGKAIFTAKCVSCHGEKAEGLVGPNLTDNSWIHGGGKLMDIYKVVNEGVLEKGMLAWGGTLSPEELRQVVVFVGSIRGTNVEGKAPEGNEIK